MHPPRILYVHGAGPQPQPVELRRELDGILFPDPPGPASDLAWYADVTDAVYRAHHAAIASEPSHAAPDLTAPPAGAGTGGTDGVLPPPNPAAVQDHGFTDLDDRLLRRARALWSGATGAWSDEVDARAEQWGGTDERGDQEERGGAERGSLLLRLIAGAGAADDRDQADGLHPGSRSEALWHFYRDVAGYLENDREIAPELRARVRDAIVRNPDPLLVLAHSLGSVIAFDVLSEPALADRRIALITVGSPLGMGTLQDRLVAWSGTRPLQIPSPVVAWRNFHASGDPVARGSDLDGLHADYHPNARVHSTQVRNEAEWHHAFVGYLRTPEVQDAIRALLGLRRPGWP